MSKEAQVVNANDGDLLGYRRGPREDHRLGAAEDTSDTYEYGQKVGRKYDLKDRSAYNLS